MKRVVAKMTVTIVLCIAFIATFVAPANAYVARICDWLAPTTGHINILILPLEFSDAPMPENYENKLYDAYFREYDPDCQYLYTDITAPCSVKDYFYKASYGKLILDGIILPPHTTPNTWRYYRNLTDPEEYHQMILDVLDDYINAGVFDPVDYDLDGDGRIDCLSVIQSTERASNGTSVAYDFPEDTQIGDREIYLRQYIISTFMDGGSIHILTQCHEVGHMIGLLDHYIGAEFYGIDDVMNGKDITHHHDAASLYMNIFEKYLLEWEDPIIITGNMGPRDIKIYAGDK